MTPTASSRISTWVARSLRRHFGIPKSEAARYAAQILDALDGRRHDKLIYTARYALMSRHNTAYAQHLFHSAFEIYRYLSRQPELAEKQPFIDSLFSNFFDNTFLLRCKETAKAERKYRQANTVLNNMTGRLNEMLSTQRLMLANISHEMRTPLNGILGYIKLMLDADSLSIEMRDYATKAYDSADILLELVSDILDATKINMGEIEIKTETFWLDSLIQQCLIPIQMMLQEKPSVVLKTRTDIPVCQIRGDRKRLQEILTNLLSNAVKYTPDGEIGFHLNILGETSGEIRIEFIISDTGVGMSEQEIKQLFSPFTRFNTEQKGIGLGMYITYKLVKKMGGTLHVESSPGEGTTFTLHLPFHRTESNFRALEGKHIHFFIDTKNTAEMPEYLELSEKLETHGARTRFHEEQKQFIDFLLHAGNEPVDFIFVSTDRSRLEDFNHLIKILKQSSRFERTLFLARQRKKDCHCNYFDHSTETLPGLSTFLRLAEEIPDGHRPIVNATAPRHILIVDDMPMNIELARIYIQNKYPHFQIDTAADGKEALQLCRRCSYDLTFVDLKMPGMNGFETVREMEKICPASPKYALTADVYKETLQLVKKAGFRGLLEKPLQTEILYSVIEKELHVSTDS